MKKYGAALLGCFFALVAFVSISNASFEVPEEGITFHQVNLVCGAATDIGCGSRSKPILLDLQKEPYIKEAWLNRTGTIVAVVWEKGIEPNVKVVPTTFKSHGKSIETLVDSDHQEQLSSFKKDRWYMGQDVDELSMEEAGRIATQIIDQLIKLEALSKEDATQMHTEVEAYIQNEFMVLEDVNLLSTPSYYQQWEKDIREIGAKYTDADKLLELQVIYPAGASCKKDSKSCCSSSCCSSSSWWSRLFN